MPAANPERLQSTFVFSTPQQSQAPPAAFLLGHSSYSKQPTPWVYLKGSEERPQDTEKAIIKRTALGNLIKLLLGMWEGGGQA